MLTQEEANRLIQLEKKKISEETYNFPIASEALSIPVVSRDGRESFQIDINRKGIIKLTKCTYQERTEVTVILVRLDIDGPPHTNPDVISVPLTSLLPYNNQTISCPHLHLYIEGFDDKWAIPVDPELFPQITDLFATLEDFFKFCNITEPPTVQGDIFT
jgi:hypothetical protein